ncbi:hypothetical protein WICMUC_002474 [Wickerhamomyces mucosus]|uniref:Enoyl reductase (ER) domain-containing protein n=1 Tax=Wickerhamomyces mucosus TaxID=1378264 RepID=A0A9P8TDT3_9ASCO|nr:hypothetical protein WICMUC_002474 [Wickerhamomyces mucosus]
MSIPETQKALKVTKDQQHLELKTVAVNPTLGPYEILVKVIAAGINHVDNYFLDGKWSTEGTGSGITASGIVLRIGENVTRFKEGDTIASFQFGSDENNKDHGAYQEYTKVLESNSFKFPLTTFEDGDIVPSGTVTTFEKAASVAASLITVGISIYHQFELANKDNNKKTILIYGGSTSVGELAVIYSHYIGWKVIAIASSKHHERLKNLGADIVIDYHSDDLTQDIKNLGQDIDFAYVTTGGQQALKQIYDSLPSDREIKLESIEYPNIDFIQDKKSNVKFSFTRAFTSHGQRIKYGNGWENDPYPGILESIKKWVLIVEDLHKKGLIQAREERIIPDGLNGVNYGLNLLKTGGAVERLVVRVDKTA